MRILDASEIDIENKSLFSDLDIDLRHLNKLEHESAPEESNAYLLKVRPSATVYGPYRYHFEFEIQYGKSEDYEVLDETLGEPVVYRSEDFQEL